MAAIFVNISIILQLFTTVLERCSHEDRVLHLRQHAPMVVAQQLYKHTSTSSQLVMAVFSLALGRPFTFDDYAVDSNPSLAHAGHVSLLFMKEFIIVFFF